jgi:TrpR family transcriptional regulator, trp operon repressor
MNNKFLNEFIDKLFEIQTREEMYEFLKGILTLQELEEIPQRLEIVRLLKEGVPQHEIAKRLGVGVATVTRGSKEIKKGRFQNV